MELNFAPGTVAMVTGGTRGIGAATVAALAAEGVQRIHIVGRRSRDTADFTAGLDGVEVVAHTADLASPADRDRLAESIAEVDVLVNNAGAIPQGSLAAGELAEWRSAWDLKVWGYLALSKAALEVMTRRRSGVIVNVIGVSGERHDAGYLAGSMANSALMSMTRTVGAYSLDDGVRVVGVNPGVVETDRLLAALRVRAETQLGDADRWQEFLADYPAKRMATPNEIADTIAFLASPRSSFTSGCIVTVDGGAAWRGRAL